VVHGVSVSVLTLPSVIKIYSFAFHTRSPILISFIPLGHGSIDGRVYFSFSLMI